MYQRAMNEMLEGIDHAYAIMDDIPVAGRDIAFHDAVLNLVLQQAKSYNLKLNFDKVRVRKQEVPYVGQVISSEGLKPRESESDEENAAANLKGRSSLIPGVHPIPG